MAWEIPDDERAYLRDLARKKAEYAALPVMAERKKQWYALNDEGACARPPVIIETWTFDRDFMPSNIYRCQSPVARGIEHALLRTIREHELIDDDKVITDTFDLGWFVSIDEFGVPIKRRQIADAEGVTLGFDWEHPIRDLERDLEKLKPAVCSVDREGTLSYKAMLEELFDGLLTVEMRTGTYGCNMLTHRVVDLMGMEAFFMAMYDQPDATHQLMSFLRDNSLRVQRWAESEGLLCVNNGNQQSFGSSYNFTTQLPVSGANGGPAQLRDMWTSANSQETVGVSPAMFHEFCFPYYRDAVEPAGLLYYGCCEPAHPFWEDIRQLPQLKKVSISRWCDERYMGDELRGGKIVFSRKPDPNFLSVDATLNEDAWAAHIRETLELTRGVPVEFIIRDVYTIHDNIGNARRAVSIAREQVDRHWQPT